MSQTSNKAATESTSIGASPVQEKKQPDALTKSVAEGPIQQHYKIVKVRKPDGTIVKVRRPITAGGMQFPSLPQPSTLFYAYTFPEAAEAQSGTAKAKPVAKSATNKKSESTTAQANSPEATIVEVKCVENSEHSTTTTPIPTISEPTPEPRAADNTEKSSTTVTTSTTETSAEKISDKTSQDSPKPTEPSVPSKTDRALDSAVKGARLYRGLHRLHRGSSRLISVLAPEWDINDWQEGDEEISDDDDDDYEEEYDSDDENDRDASESRGMTNTDVNAASKEIGTAAAANVATLKTPRQQSDIVDSKAVDKPIDIKNAEKVKLPIVNEKELPASDPGKDSLEKPADAATEGRSLHQHYKDWSRYIIYAIMMLFPLLFMSSSLLLPPELFFPLTN